MGKCSSYETATCTISYYFMLYIKAPATRTVGQIPAATCFCPYSLLHKSHACISCSDSQCLKYCPVLSGKGLLMKNMYYYDTIKLFGQLFAFCVSLYILFYAFKALFESTTW